PHNCWSYNRAVHTFPTRRSSDLASGAGAQNMRELISQMGAIHASVADKLADPASAILEIDRQVAETMRSEGFPRDNFGHPLAGRDRKSTRLNSSHVKKSYAVLCL